jgi:predicted transcriptional regulator
MSRPYSQIFNLNVNRESAYKAGKRDKLEIYYDILHTFYTEEHSSGKGKQSFAKIASQVNMPYNRFKKTLTQLNSLKLCNLDGKKVQVTEKGQEFIMEYQSFNDYLKQIGLVKETPHLHIA